MSVFTVHQYPYNADNYGVLLHSPETGETVCIDSGDASVTLAEIDKTGWSLTDIWITHHHADHTAGIAEIKQQTGARVLGPGYGKPLAVVDTPLREGDALQFSGRRVDVLHTPGHTLDMLNYHIADEKLVFTGDTLFALGCGRLFEGDADTLWQSLGKLMALPADTRIYCSHEYTLANARFAVTIDPDNHSLAQRLEEIEQLRAEGRPTVPTTLALELATNPFLRASDPAIRAHLAMGSASDAEVFARIRQLKDAF